MTLTRSQRGVTPRKTEHPGYVETPSRRKSRRISPTPPIDEGDATGSELEGSALLKAANGHGNGHAKPLSKSSNGQAISTSAPATAPDPDFKIDKSGHIEFGGTYGVAAIMTGFPLLMYYMWLGAMYYDGGLPMRADGQSWSSFAQQLGALIYEGAFPHARAWAIYWGFGIFEMACACLLPGVWSKGKPLEHLGGRQLDYYCNGMWSLCVTLMVVAALHFTGLFKLYTVVDEFGPIMSVAIISGIVVSFVAYFSALWRGAEHRMTGLPVYDFFMGAELNPRMFGILDLKMFFEVRIPWYMLLLTSLSAAARQYELYGYVSGEVVFLIMAHSLYANACSKGEDLIPPTWDMYYEKWGFMLIFWNMAGVPLSYCHCTLYLANHDPSTYRWNKFALAALFISYLFVYWVWDTANSQKNRFRQQERGGFVMRKTFPQLPWQTVKNPKTIPTKTGDSLLADGWYGYARKVHYACDMYFALTWALITGFNSPYPWFYPVFFAAMIAHRAWRDNQRCEGKYGDAWKEYTKQVPYLFIPYVF